MTALSDALEAARSSAVTTLGKKYVRGTIDAEDVIADLNAMGLTDQVDQAQLLSAWMTIRQYGGEPPAETNGKPKPEPATEKQKAFIVKLCDEKQQPYPDDVRSKDEAHKIIEELQAGTYDAEKWRIPF